MAPLPPAEQEAHRRATLLQSILEAFPHGVCVYGADHRVAMFNRAYAQVMEGAPLNIGDRLEDVIRHRAEAGEYGPGTIDEIVAQQMFFDVTRPQVRKRRRPNGMTLDVRTTPLPDGGYISVVTDISALADAEAQISRRAEEMAIMLSCIRHGVILWGPDHRLLAANAIAAELLNHPPGLLTPGQTQDNSAKLVGARPFRDRRGSTRASTRTGSSGPNRVLPAADHHAGWPGARSLLGSHAGRRLGHHIYRRDGGAGGTG